MTIVSGFGMAFDLERCTVRNWYVDKDDVERWADNDEPREGQLLKGNADLVPALHATLETKD